MLAPSVRVGPVLIDPAKVRAAEGDLGLPERPALHPPRHAARRWKDDPILAATQTALLPDLPHEVQEGYIRIAPDTGSGEPTP